MLVLAALSLTACRQDMHDNPRGEPLEASRMFADGSASRPLIEGTVARGHLNDDDFLYTGRSGGQPVAEFPFAITRRELDRGEERFNIYCAPCHSRLGDGHGMVVQRGYRQPPSFHIDRLREAPPGYVFDVITNGFGVMPDYRSQLTVEDRWAVVAYLKALQLSQNATMADVPEAERGSLMPGAARAGEPPAPGTPRTGGH
ncbi:MAG TPA: cytochrome c [Vicinamibacterales bacterium]|nr:cytochrome c [Vicinamibacterales bacterium]